MTQGVCKIVGHELHRPPVVALTDFFQVCTSRSDFSKAEQQTYIIIFSINHIFNIPFASRTCRSPKMDPWIVPFLFLSKVLYGHPLRICKISPPYFKLISDSPGRQEVQKECTLIFHFLNPQFHNQGYPRICYVAHAAVSLCYQLVPLIVNVSI